MATWMFDVIEDEDHPQHVYSDMERASGPEEREYYRRELDNLMDGTWAAYGTVLVKVCECCGHGERDYSHALWGTVIDPVVPGRYALADLPDDHLREVAAELFRESVDN